MWTRTLLHVSNKCQKRGKVCEMNIRMRESNIPSVYAQFVYFRRSFRLILMNTNNIYGIYHTFSLLCDGHGR